MYMQGAGKNMSQFRSRRDEKGQLIFYNTGLSFKAGTGNVEMAMGNVEMEMEMENGKRGIFKMLNL